MKTIKKVLIVFPLFLLMIIAGQNKAAAQTTNDGYYTYQTTDQIGVYFGDSPDYPPAYQIESSDPLSDLVSFNIFNSGSTYLYDVSIIDGQATNFSISGSVVSFNLTAGQYIKLKIVFQGPNGEIDKYISFYRDL